MNSVQGGDPWDFDDDGVLNDIIEATVRAETEKASAAALSSSSGGVGAAPSPFPGDHPRRPPSDPPTASATASAISSSAASCSLPPPPPVRVAPRAPPPVPLAHNGTQAVWKEGEDPVAARHPVGFPYDGGVDNREYDFSPPRELSQREARSESSSAVEERVSVKRVGLKNAGRGRGSAGRLRAEREKDKKIDKLKGELGRVSTKLDCVIQEREHHKLQKDGSKKDKGLECALSDIMPRDAELECPKKEKLLRSEQNHSQAYLQAHCPRIAVEQNVQFPISEEKSAQSLPCYVASTTKDMYSISNEPVAPLRDPSLDFPLPESYVKKRKNFQSDEPSAVSELKCRVTNNDDGLSTSNGCFIQSGLPPEENVQLHHLKGIGIQTELDSIHHTSEGGLLLHDISSKLLSIWGSTERMSGRHLISRVLVSSSTDLYVLFRFIGIPSDINMDLLMDRMFFDVALSDPMHSVQSAEAQKVSRLYSVMMKMRREMAELGDLVDALVELCALENVILVHRSLCILHAVLQTICFRGSYKRDNIVITQFHNDTFHGEGGTRAVDMGLESEETENACNIGKHLIALPSGSFDLQNPWSDEYKSSGSSSALSLSRWISLFESMHKIVVSNTKANIQLEAISVMNLILWRSDPISERGKLGLMPSFTTVSHILCKEGDACMKRQAVKLLFLLLNCPRLLRIFCTGRGEDDDEHEESADSEDEASRLHELLSTIPRGLADCIVDEGSNTLELILSKEAIILLAFIASSGKSGFAILLSPTTKCGNFFELIVNVLCAQTDRQAGGFGESHDLHKERTALIREALILLNRLASHAVYSRPTLGVLTQSTTMATLIVDVVNRICHEMSNDCKRDSMKKALMETEIVDLARLLRNRILSFLGENSS